MSWRVSKRFLPKQRIYDPLHRFRTYSINSADLSIAGITDSAEYDVTVCGPLDVSKEIATRTAAVTINLQNYYTFVINAAGQVNDPPTQRLRTAHYRGYNSEVIAGLAMGGTGGSFSVGGAGGGGLVLPPLSNDDKASLKESIPGIEEIDRQLRAWNNSYRNNTWEILTVYADAMTLSANQKAMATLLQDAL
jgi:hypothetical protein